MNARKLKTLVDELGQIKAEVAILKNDESALRQQLLDAGVKVAEGDLFRATVVDADRKIVDWKSICEALEPSRQLVTAHTSHSTVTSVRVTARIGVAA